MKYKGEEIRIQGRHSKPTMSVFTWKNLSLTTVLVTLLSGMFAQTPTDRVGPITSALRNREFEKALQLLQPALQESPKNPQLPFFQGMAHSGMGNQKAALACYRSALKIAPDYLPALEGAAQLEYDAGSASAVPLLQHILRDYIPTTKPAMPCSPCLLTKRGTAARLCSISRRVVLVVDSQPGALQEYGACLVELKLNGEGDSCFSTDFGISIRRSAGSAGPWQQFN